MLGEGVAGHEVQEHSESELVRTGHQGVEILKGAERRLHAPKVADVIAVVRVGRRVDRRQPHRLHAQLRDVIQPLGHARQVADPVPIGVLERPYVDLVDGRLLPPHGA